MQFIWEPEDITSSRVVTIHGGYQAIIAKQNGAHSSSVYALVHLFDGAMSELYDRPSMARYLTSIGAQPNFSVSKKI